MKYHQVYEGEWVYPVMKGYKMACCSCSLVHRIDFQIKRKGKRSTLRFRAFKDNRATAAARRKVRAISK